MSGPEPVPGALAWRAEIEMTPRARDTFLSGRWVARLATNGRDGFPHIAPSYYYWDGRAIYISLTRTRVAGRNLTRDPRCALVIDADERPLRGMADNAAMAVTIAGEAELYSVDDGEILTVDGGPWAGEVTAGDMLGRVLLRYGLWIRDGVVAGSHDDVIAAVADAPENQGRVIAKIVPQRLRSWDFSKAPMLSS